MKSKKENIEKIVLVILTFILVLYISIGLIFFCIFNISEKFFNKNGITKILDSINISDIFKDKMGNELTEFVQIQDELFNIGITTKGLNEFINSEDVKELGVDVVTNVFDKASNKRNIDYKITNEQINTLITNNVDKLVINSTIDSNQILNKVQSKIPNLVLNINEMLDKLFDKLENCDEFKIYQNYMYSLIDLLDLIYSNFVKFLIIFIIISFIILLIFIRKNVYKSLKWLSLSFLLPSVFFFVLNKFMCKLVMNNILLNNAIKEIGKITIKYSIIFIIISGVFGLLNIIIYITKKYKKKVSYE